MNIEDFDWGITSEWYRKTIGNEFFEKNLYFKFFNVEKGDIVLDLGASIGPFGYVIKDNNIKHLYSFEPSTGLIPTLVKNTESLPSTILPYAIGSENKMEIINTLDVYHSELSFMPVLKFKNFIEDFKIEKIDFLKTDCEGGEYDVFNDENFEWITKNVNKIVGEWHLNTPEKKEKFRKFRDTYLKYYKNFNLRDVSGKIDIKWDLWNEHFLEYYNEVIIYIDNR